MEDGRRRQHIRPFSFAFIMGQEQSVPAPRRAPNKLSKPKTNSTGNLLSKIPGTPSRQSSQSNDVSPIKSRLSLLVPNGGSEAGEKKKEEKQRNRMSLFRSKSSQAKEREREKVKEMEMENEKEKETGPAFELGQGVEREFVNSSPVELPAAPVRRHSRANSATFEEQAEERQSQRYVLFCFRFTF